MEELSADTLGLLKVLAATNRCSTEEEIAEQTRIDIEEVRDYLDRLRDLGLVSEKGDKYCSLEPVRQMQRQFKRCESCFSA